MTYLHFISLSSKLIYYSPNNFVKAKDKRVIANTIVIGGGETISTKFSVNKLNAKNKYVFFCSFLGHAGIMKGIINLV